MFQGLKKVFKNKDINEIFSPIEGKAVSIKEVNDPTFSDELLGKGVAVIPKKGRIVAPIDGVLSVVFETKHAISITTENGIEILIHIGLDTVNLKGEYYKAYKKQGDKVKIGDLIIEFDIDAIKSKGYDIITPIVICNSSEYPNMDIYLGDVNELDKIFTLNNK